MTEWRETSPFDPRLEPDIAAAMAKTSEHHPEVYWLRSTITGAVIPMLPRRRPEPIPERIQRQLEALGRLLNSGNGEPTDPGDTPARAHIPGRASRRHPRRPSHLGRPSPSADGDLPATAADGVGLPPDRIAGAELEDEDRLLG